ncbi:NlpC/P60 family protein [Hominisplanchenecus murintestinalis]|uniref:C40 family peptidase n=1 Tax=Hominisplanchenecus murintestinalis TaxID=2941517 RepID=UPI00203B3314|nr:NlpC/P60 family protein [Hominisplanchenecus murintestinalis]
MKIRKVEEKPMKLHTKEGPKLRIRAKGKTKTGRMKVHKVKKSPLSGLKQRVKTSNSSIQIKKQQLHVLGRKAAKEMDGGEEIADSIDVALAFSYPLVSAASKGVKLLRNKKHQKDKQRKEDKSKDNRKRGAYSRSDSDTINAKEVERRKAAIKTKNSNLKKKDGKAGGNKREDLSYKSGRGSAKSRMITAFITNMWADEEEKASLSTAAKQTVKRELAILIKKIMATVLPGFLGLFSVVALCGVAVVAVLAIIYNSPFAIFFPLPDSGTEDVRTVLVGYYQEFNEKIFELEESGENVVYKNSEDGVPVSNFNDTLMVYMLLYGDGKAAYVMDEDGKKNLKKVFDEMNRIDAASSAVEMDVGDSLGKVWVTAYCPCSQCCGPYANGITASGKTARAKHTIAVDAYNPIVPMGTKVVIEGTVYTVEDTGNLNHYGNDFDIFYAKHNQTSQWGRRHVEAYIAEGNTNKVSVTSSGATVQNLTYKDYMSQNALTDDQKEVLEELMSADASILVASGEVGTQVAQMAMTKVGCGYSQDKRMQEGWYDCSSLVYRLYKEAGIILNETASTQGKQCYQKAQIINKKDLQPGDLIFYSYEDNGQFRNISHVAIYVGDGKMVHAANPSRGVVLDPLRTGNVVFYARPYG